MMRNRRHERIAALILAMVSLSPCAAQAPIPPARPDTTRWSIEQSHGPPVPFAVTLDEGTWISLDVSPDGRTIVFDLLGDLYTLPINGGSATRITSGPAYDMQPRFSPDGRRVAFVSDRSGSDNIWTIGSDGNNATPITADRTAKFNSPAWTHDGRYIVARRHDLMTMVDGLFELHELYLVHLAGGQGVSLVPKERNPYGPAPSPDGRWIYFTTGAFATGGSVIRRYDRATGEILPLTSGFGGAVRPTVSRDGRWLAFGRRIDAEEVLILRDLETGAERILYGPLDRDDQEGLESGGAGSAADLLPGFAFTPDGTAIIVAARGKLRRIDVATGAASVIPFTARFEQTLTEKIYVPSRIEDGPIELRLFRWAHSSPDGRWIVFSAAGRCYRYAVATKQVHPLGAGRGLQYSPATSPDGRWVAYVNWEDTVGAHVYKVPLEGGSPVRLTARPAHYEHLAWSTDGGKLVLLQGSGEEFRGGSGGETLYHEIRWLDASSQGAARFIATIRPRTGRRQNVRPSFNSTGERVFFAESPEAVFSPEYTELVSVRLDGTDKRRHLRFKFADDIIPSPDGTWVAFTEQFNSYLTPFPTSGKEPIDVVLNGGSLPVIKLSQAGGYFVNWAAGGREVTWGWGSRFYRSKLAGASTPNVAVVPEETTISLQLPRAAPAGSLLLRGARILTMADSGVIERGDILVERNRIAALGKSGTVKSPLGVTVIDVSGKTIIPGLIDLHAHYPFDNTEIIPERNWNPIAQLAYGVTTSRDPSARSQMAFTLAEMVETGLILGPRILSTGDILWLYETPFSSPMKSLDDARNQVRRLRELGATYIKQYMQPRREQRQWVLQAAREQGIMVTPEDADMPFNLTMVMDGHTGLEHAIPIAPLYKDVISLLAKAGTYYTPTLIVSWGGPSAEPYFYQQSELHHAEKLRRFTPHALLDAKARRRALIPEDEYHFLEIARSAAALLRAGGKVTLGSHGNRPGLGAHWEIWALALGGLSPMEVLRTGTVLPAEALGLQRDIGSLEVGKLADLVVLNANPIEDIRNTERIEYVMKNGVVWLGETMAEVWPKPQPLDPFFWEAYQSSRPSRRNTQ